MYIAAGDLAARRSLLKRSRVNTNDATQTMHLITLIGVTLTKK